MDREGDLEEAQKVLSVNKCKRFQKVNKELIVTARKTGQNISTSQMYPNQSKEVKVRKNG